MKTVNFLEAVNSGKRFRPLSFSHWIEVKNDYLFGDQEYTKSKVFYNCQFELEEKEITITEKEFMSKFEETFGFGTRESQCLINLKKELGF